MPGPLTAAGAAPEPSEYAPLTMDRYITGMWTQRSPLRDADVPYLYTKFYSASRFDSIIDGVNCEVTSRLTLARRPGSSIFSNFSVGSINTFYSFNAIQVNGQKIYVIADATTDEGASAVYDLLDQSVIYEKTAGAGTTRFLGLGPELFMADAKKSNAWLQYGPWPGATQAVQPGTLITIENSAGTALQVEMALGGITMSIIASQYDGVNWTLWVDPSTIPLQFANLIGVNVAFSGLTAAAALNGQTLPVTQIISSTTGIFQVQHAGAAYSRTTDAGSSTTGNGITGGAAPAFPVSTHGVVQDAGQQWKSYGGPTIPWGLPQPAPFTNIIANNCRFWLKNTAIAKWYSVIDPNGNIQICTTAGNTGQVYPSFVSTPIGSTTLDGTAQWFNAGPPGTWAVEQAFGTYTPANGGTLCIVDQNGNLQYASTPGTSGGAPPAFSDNPGTPVADGTVTWTSLGAGSILTTGNLQYAYSTHSIDGSVSSASAPFTLFGGILGSASILQLNPGEGPTFLVPAAVLENSQVDQIWWWRTAQGQSTLILLDQTPVDNTSGPNEYADNFIPDTSSNGSPSLDALIPAPIAGANNPPPLGFTAPAYHMNRVWGIVGNTVQYSGGPDTITGNGNTAFAALSSFSYPELITKLVPFTTNNGGLLVCGTRNVYVILGTGTSTNPFYSTTYMPTVGFLGYDAITIVGSTLYGFTSNNKFISLDPSAGYVECGFPIGDQFNKVTTGGINTALYNPATTYVSWNERSSGDSGIYVADGAVGWFRYSPVASPESGYLWSPRAAIEGGTSAVMSVETSPGVQTLLIGPKVSGDTLFRDDTVNADNGVPYDDCFVTIGNVVLCETGEVAEVAHITLDSIKVGTQPTVGLLFGEIAATSAVPFDMLEVTSSDPPLLGENGAQSQTLFSDRYVAMQNGVCPKCRHLQLMVQWAVENAPNELLGHSIFGAKHAERKQQ